MKEVQLSWTKQYQQQVSRNIGLITEQQQEKLRKSKVAVFGLGGLGGPCFEILVRSGIENFAIVDKDTFEPSNLNRQNFAFLSTCGKQKVDAAQKFCLDINPGLKISKFSTVSEANISVVLEGVNAAVLALDEFQACIIIARQCREMQIPLVEGWALPCGNVRVFDSDTPTLEETYGLDTGNRPATDFDNEKFWLSSGNLVQDLLSIEGVSDFYNDEVGQKISQGVPPSFAPMVWLTSVLMAIETVKTLLGIGNMAAAPSFSLYDPFNRRIPASTKKSTS